VSNKTTITEKKTQTDRSAAGERHTDSSRTSGQNSTERHADSKPGTESSTERRGDNNAGVQNSTEKHADSKSGTENSTERRVETKTVVENKADTFTIKAPTLSTSLKQGEKKEVEISISRGNEFTQPVKLSFTNIPAGLKVDTTEPQVKTDESNAKVWVEATKTATPGDYTIQVTGTPETGKATTASMKVTVKNN